MAKSAAGILMYRGSGRSAEFLLVHPGGPFWKNKDAGAWSIPKGEIDTDEDPLAAALREFEEETGTSLSGDFIGLTPVKQKSGKIVHAWAVKGDLDINGIKSNTFQMEWPPNSGKQQTFDEIDRAGWFSFEECSEKIIPAQMAFVTELFFLMNA